MEPDVTTSINMQGGTSGQSELRIVLLGNVESGKSTAGNTILGREEFESMATAQCVKRQGEVAGRHITVVEAPGWWTDTPIKESTEFLKSEIVLSVSLCFPGPHALLLVMRLDTEFSKDKRMVLIEHLKLLTESVWGHTIVLFTCGDMLRDTPIEQLIESKGKDLQWLVEKCGNRYHVFNNKKNDDTSQVRELLEIIQEMVAANNGHCFEMDRKILQEVEDKSRVNKERAKERMKKVRKQRNILRTLIMHTPGVPELRIVLLGYRYAGKSSAGNTILGNEDFKTAAQCVKREGEVVGKHITVVEAPGWSNRGSEENTEAHKQQVMLSVSLCPPGPHCLLLVIRVDIVFEENEGNILDGFMKLFGQRVWSHTMVLFTFGDYLGDRPIEEHIESEGKTLQWLVEKCRNRYHVLNNMNRNDYTQVKELLEKIVEIVAVNRGCHFKIGRTILKTLEEKKQEAARTKEKMMNAEGLRENIKACVASRGLHIDQHLEDAEEFVPEILENDSEIKNNYSHRFLCNHAGKYQCKPTSLVFVMKGEGEVLYRIDSWDADCLDRVGQMQPAGPLYNIDCLEGSITHLYLPHCEILTGGDQVDLRVAHFTGDNMEIVKPLKMTNTHVIISVEGLSLFGLLKYFLFYNSPINAQVLLFYGEITAMQSRNELLIHLLPSNVPVIEVKKQHKGRHYFKTSSTCQLTPGVRYRISCDPHKSYPKAAKFECDYGPNYHPTFVVYFKAEEITVSLFNEDGMEVWEPRPVFLSGHQKDAALHEKIKGAEFVDKHRDKLIQNVLCVMELADSLQSHGMITREIYNNIKAAKTSQEQMRILYAILDSAGQAVKETFFEVLMEKQFYLVDVLESGAREAYF